jgi:choline dehydrogenase
LNFLAEAEDRKRILEAVKLVCKIAQTEPLRSLIAQELNPGTQVTNDEDILASIKITLDSYEHPFSSVPMGPESSKTAVVDFYRKVYGVKGLRVVDASIFPDAVSAAPNPTVIMTAEKIADEIKNKLGKQLLKTLTQ